MLADRSRIELLPRFDQRDRPPHEGGGDRCPRFQRRRAGLPHAAVGEGSRRAIEGDVTRYTANEGTQSCARRSPRSCGARQRPHVRHRRDPRFARSEGLHLLCVDGAVRRGRSPDADAVLGVVSGADPPGGGDAGAAAREANGSGITPAELSAAITPRTRGLILNYPSNPPSVLRPGRACRARERRDRKNPRSSPTRSREADLRRHVHELAAISRSRGAHRRRQRDEQSLCDDRLEDRLRRRPEGLDRSDGEGPSHATSHPASMAQAAGWRAPPGRS